MRLHVCDICGKQIKPDKYTYTPKDTKGRFTFDYQQAIADDNGNVVDFGYCYEFNVCADCQRIGNEALWAAFKEILDNREKTVADVHVPAFPPEPQTMKAPTPVCPRLEEDPFG